jgi:hypothetical protein
MHVTGVVFLVYTVGIGLTDRPHFRGEIGFVFCVHDLADPKSWIK